MGKHTRKIRTKTNPVIELEVDNVIRERVTSYIAKKEPNIKKTQQSFIYIYIYMKPWDVYFKAVKIGEKYIYFCYW